ncbi:DUF7691 family protein [Chitinophaga sp. RAB17]|uniref:DUF7691 family protein n=1 Tax=Chitinophaga sp. RAB17 TaxID=3233049 RepID=UPI003F931526
MGTVAIPFAVDIKKVQQVFGSKDRELLDKIKTAKLYKHYSRDDSTPAEYRYDFDQLLEDIIFRYIPPGERKVSTGFLGMFKSPPDTGLNKKMGYAYGYVLLVICDYLGTHLMPQCDGFYYGRDWDSACEILNENGLTINLSKIFEAQPIFDIPISIDDFPAISSLSKEEIAHIYAVSKTIEIDEAAADMNRNDFDEVQVMLKDIRNSISTCYDAQLDFISFAH